MNETGNKEKYFSYLLLLLLIQDIKDTHIKIQDIKDLPAILNLLPNSHTNEHTDFIMRASN